MNLQWTRSYGSLVKLYYQGETVEMGEETVEMGEVEVVLLVSYLWVSAGT